jgi:hypothetical protein
MNNNICLRLAQTALLSVILAILGPNLFAQDAKDKLEPARIREIAGWLPEQPAGFAWPITNRAAWDKLAADPVFSGTIRIADKLLAKPLEDVPDSLFLEYSQNGNRTHWQDAEFRRRTRIQQLVFAEALENKGRFLPAIEQLVATLCAEKTWVYPAHDGSLANFKGLEVNPELGATGLAAELAEANYILGDKLSPATRQLILDNVRRRVLIPFRDSVEGRRKPLHWLFLKMNWNSVCVGNTVFAAMALEPSRDDRAVYAAAGEHYIHYFLEGFTPDGYCAEGVGYWNYGFGHFILLTEILRQATGGKIDLLNDDLAIAGAQFCRRSEILPGIFLTIADCTPGNKPSSQLTAYVCRRLGLPLHDEKLAGQTSELAVCSMLSSLPENLPVARNVGNSGNSPLRSFFWNNGVLISRNTPDTAPFAVAIKGGCNAGPHNHDDSGSFSLVMGRDMMVCDSGGEVYTKRTFGPHRFDSKVLNSYGHAVPIIAGKLQKDGLDARADMLETNFSADSDVLKLDMRSAYPVPSLQKLERTFTLKRGNNPSLEVSDAVKFSSPEQFETALITWGKVKEIGPNTLEIADGDSRVRVTIDTRGHPFKWSSDLIDEDTEGKRKPYHLGITLTDKISDGVITLRIEPVGKQS